MRLHNFTINDMGPFRGTTYVDLDAIHAQLIAIWGPSGAGKTTLVELACLASLYRQTATRGSIGDLATGRHSYVESTVTGSDGVRFTVRQSYDAESESGSSLLTGVDGKPLRNRDGKEYLTSTGVKAYDAWAKTHLQAPSVHLASAFATQEASRGLGVKGAMGLLTMNACERRSVVLRAMGAERLDEKVDVARKAASAASLVRDTLVARIGDEKARGGTVEAAGEALARAEDAKEAADSAVVKAVAAKANLLPRIERAVEAKRAALVATKHKDDLEAAREVALTAVEALSKRAANNRSVLNDAAKIRAAVARVASIDAELKANATLQRDHSAELAVIARDTALADKALFVATVAVQDATRQLQYAAEDLDQREWTEATAAKMPELQAIYDTAESTHKRAIDAVEAERTATLTTADRRIGGLRHGLTKIGEIKCEFDDARLRYEVEVRCGVETTLDDDNTIRVMATSAPKRLAALIEARSNASNDVNNAKHNLKLAVDANARLPAIKAALISHDEATKTRIKAQLDEQTAQSTLTEHSKKAIRVGDLLATVRREATILEQERSKLAPLLRFASNLDTAEARLAEIEPQLATHRSETERLTDAIDSLPVIVAAPMDAPSPDELPRCERALSVANSVAMTAHASVAVAREALKQADESQLRIASMEANRVAADSEVADWLLLVEGVKGVQADLADSAGPELSAIANDLLRTCYGPRWTLKVSTVHEGSKGQAVEGYDLLVTDSHNGREGDGSTYSPGERALLGAALADAVATLACRHAGLVGVGITLVRDECDAPLDETMAMAWLAMVRRTAELCGASRTLIITHRVAVRDACDMILAVEQGVVTVKEPGTL